MSEVEDLKERQSRVWGLGDYAVLSTSGEVKVGGFLPSMIAMSYHLVFVREPPRRGHPVAPAQVRWPIQRARGSDLRPLVAAWIVWACLERPCR
mgnify:CR=1 FL=1